jgi:soluble lytic murein transglycosylase-like protein
MLLLSLGGLTLFIINNEYQAYKLNKSIAAAKKESITLEYQIQQYRERNDIAQLLCNISNSRLKKETILQLTNTVYLNSEQFGYDPVLLLAVIHVESVFDSRALGRFRSGTLSGAMGLMQLKIETAQEMANRLNMGTITNDDLLKPEVNIVLGVAYLTRLISRFKSFKLGLLAYNQGPGTIIKSLYNKEPLSVSYYKKVLKSYYKLQQLANNTPAGDKYSYCW